MIENEKKKATVAESIVILFNAIIGLCVKPKQAKQPK